MDTRKPLLAAVSALLIAGCATHGGGVLDSQDADDKTEHESADKHEPEQQARDANQADQQAESSAPDTEPRESKSGKTPPRSASEVSSAAVMSLLDNADQLIKAKKLDAAASTLERALNLDPRNPFIYQRLAALRLAQKEYEQAEQMARKSNSVAADNPFVKQDNWQLIAKARQANQDGSGAQAAKTRAVSYSRSADQYR